MILTISVIAKNPLAKERSAVALMGAFEPTTPTPIMVTKTAATIYIAQRHDWDTGRDIAYQ